jgi:hypothetical protein
MARLCGTEEMLQPDAEWLRTWGADIEIESGTTPCENVGEVLVEPV